MSFFFIKNFFLGFFYLEKKNLSNSLQYLNFLVKETNLFKYILYRFFKIKINPIKSKNFNIFLTKNYKKWKSSGHTNKKKIIVENFINHPGYTLSNAICAKYLSEIYKFELIGFIREGDIKAELIFKSFNINNIIKIEKPNIFKRLKYLIISLKLCKKNQNIEKFCKLKYDRVELGLSTYDTYIRYTKKPSLNYINTELIVLFSQAISSYFYFKNFLKIYQNEIKLSVQSETVFNPQNIFFQTCLKNNIEIFARCGENDISLRRYTKWNQRNDYRYNISTKLFNFVEKNMSKKLFKKVKKIYIKKKDNINYGFDTKIPLIDNKRNKKINKNEILKFFNWQDNKKIIVFFMNVLIDRNFHFGPRTNFKDNYTWTKYILGKIKKIKKVNWIIKKHPIEKLYDSKFDLNKEISSISKKYKHVKIFPENFNNASLLDIADKIITSHGTAGIEYPAYGIESLFVEKSLYSNMPFTKMLKSKKQIDLKLKNLHKQNRVPKIIQEKSMLFLFIQDFLIKINCSFIPVYLISRQIDFDNFWKLAVKKIRNKNFQNDNFFLALKKQIKYKMRHTMNFKYLKVIPEEFKDFD